MISNDASIGITAEIEDFSSELCHCVGFACTLARRVKAVTVCQVELYSLSCSRLIRDMPGCSVAAKNR